MAYQLSWGIRTHGAAGQLLERGPLANQLCVHDPTSRRQSGRACNGGTLEAMLVALVAQQSGHLRENRFVYERSG